MGNDRLFHSLANCARVIALLLLSAGAPAIAQEPAPPQLAAEQPAELGQQEFAPGVVTTIPPAVDRADALSIHDMVEIRADESLEWEPSKWLQWESATPAPTNRTLYEMAKNAAYPLDVWCLELAFKPLRMIEVDVPQPSGRMQRKLIWYMVYRVRNTGAGLVPQIQPDGSFVTEAKGVEPVKFQPQFVLMSQDRQAGEQRVRKAYLDRIIPAALEPIRRREMSDGQLLNSVEMTEQELPIEAGRAQRGVWGVVTWEDVDPSLDFFSVFVGGLTNAYQWTDPEGAYKLGDPPGTGRKFTRKTLQLNFWRPGDEIDQNEREIRFGVAPQQGALYDVGEGVAYRWVYR